MENGIPGSELTTANSIASTDYVLGLVDEGNGPRTRKIPRSLLGGVQGPTGATGATGATGPAGPAGPAGADGGQLLVGNGWAIDDFESYDEGAISVLDGGAGWAENGEVASGSIVTRTLRSGVTQKRLRIAPGGDGGGFKRKFSFKNDWGQLGIMILFRVEGASANILSSVVEFSVGCVNTDGNVLYDGGATNMIGFSDDGAPWTYVAGTEINRFSQSVGHQFITEQSGSRTNRGTGSGSDGRRYALSEAGLSAAFLHIARPPVYQSPGTTQTYSTSLRTTPSTYIEYTLPKSKMSNFLAFDSAAFNSELSYCGGNAVTASFSFATPETPGVLDGVHVHWNTPGYNLEIAGVAIKQIL